MTTVRRTKWRPTLPPQPSPRIIHLPSRRIRRRKPHETLTKRHISGGRGTLGTLLDQEAPFTRSVPIVLLNSWNHKPRERVKQNDEQQGGGEEFIEEKWRFQAEILRAECNFLRMERELAMQKLERNHFHIESTLRSAIQTLVSGRKMIKEEKKVTEVLEEVIEELVEKLRQLQRKSMVDRDFEVRKCSNFDKEATLLRRKLEKLKLGPSSSSDDNHTHEIRNLAESSLSINTKFFSDVEILRKKMEGSSKGMLERVEEECGSISSSASTSRRTESADSSSSSTSTRQPYQEMSREQKVCSGHCKVVVRRIVEQVRAEKEQWSQMQAMLGQVRQEMEELQASRDFWETRALDSDFQVQSLHWNAQEWRQKSLSLETKTNELQNKISSLEQELERLRKANAHSSVLGDQHEKEKRVVICRLKENHRINGASARQKEKFGDGRRNSFSGNNGGVAALKRSPFQDVGNLSPLLRQKSKLLFPL